MPVIRLLLIVSAISSSTFADEEKPTPRKQLLIIAHRGLLKHAPENTPAAFQSCMNLRFGFELDVQRSKEGKLVCLHDSTLNRTTNAKGKVSDKTWVEIQKIDAGSWFDPAFQNERIPLVESVFAMLARVKHSSILIAVDVKLDDPTIERDLVLLAKKHRVLHRLMFIGNTIQSEKMRKRFKEADKSAPVAHLANTLKELPAVLKNPAADWAYIRFVPTREQVDFIHRIGKRVFLVGTKVAGLQPENWRTAAKNGVDAILTDYPLELRKAIRDIRR